MAIHTIAGHWTCKCKDLFASQVSRRRVEGNFVTLSRMFGFLKRKVPLSTFARVDIELLLRRNIEVVGRDDVLGAKVLTSVNELQLDNQSTDALVKSASRAVADRMSMQPIDPSFGDEDQLDHFAADPLRVVVEIANQHAHQFWLSQPSPRPLDHHPRTTTLLPVCFGFGILASSAALQESHWTAAGYSGWSMSRCGYYSSIEFGYALALFARYRGETDPAWLQSLRLDAATIARDAASLFAKHQADGGKLLFDATRIPGTDCDVSDLANWISGSDARFAMAAAYALAKLESLPTVATDAAHRLTMSKDQELVVLAARLLGSADADDPRIKARITELAASKIAVISLAAIHSASRLGMPVNSFKLRIEKLLADPAMDVLPLIELMSIHARELTALAGAVCRQAELAIKYQDSEATTALLACLAKMVDDPVTEVVRYIRSRDIQTRAIEVLSAEILHGGSNESHNEHS